MARHLITQVALGAAAVLAAVTIAPSAASAAIDYSGAVFVRTGE